MTLPVPARPLNVVVVGATFLDAIYRVSIEPRLERTVYAAEAATMPGGKGLNQAVAFARYGTSVNLTFVTVRGGDVQGEAITEQLRRGEAENAAMRVEGPVARRTRTVTVLVQADRHGMLAPPLVDVEQRLGPPEIEACSAAVTAADVILATYDYPEAIEPLVEIARRQSTKRPLLILNPAPAASPGSVRSSVLMEFDWVIPNVAEARALLGQTRRGAADARRAEDDQDLGNASELAAAIRSHFGVSACVTASEKGCAWALDPARVAFDASDGVGDMNAIGVVPTDVTGASDAFCAAFAYVLACGRGTGLDAGTVRSAIRSATAAGAAAVQSLGSSDSMPSRDDIEALLARADGDDRASGARKRWWQ